MSIKYKINVLQALKNKGFSTYKLRKDKIFGEATIQKFRNGEMVSYENVNTLCKVLNCQPGDIMEYVEDESEDEQ